jgi:hypothetical protein
LFSRVDALLESECSHTVNLFLGHWLVVAAAGDGLDVERSLQRPGHGLVLAQLPLDVGGSRPGRSRIRRGPPEGAEKRAAVARRAAVGLF